MTRKKKEDEEERRTLSENMPSLGFAKMVSGFFFMSKFRLAFIVLIGVLPLQGALPAKR